MSVDDNTVASAPAASNGGLSAAEQAYMDSGGTNVEGLLAEYGNAAAADGADDAAKTSGEVDTGKTPSDGAAESAGKADTKAGEGAKAGDGKAADTKAADPGTGPDDDGAADAHAADPQKPPPQRVSYHKFRREEEKRKATERELAEIKEKFARGDERMRLLTEALTPPQIEKKAAEEDPEPDPQKDLFAWIEWSKRDRARLQDEIRSTKDGFGKTTQTIEAERADNALKSDYQRDAVAFARENPDFGAAYQHLLNTRGAMLAALGYSQEEATKIVANEERGIVQRARALGRRPAEMIYGLAKEFGYRKAEPAAGDAAAAKAGNGADAKPGNGKTEGEGAKSSVTEEIARIKAGQEAGKTLSGAGGSANEISREALATMTDAEFQAYYAQNRGKVEALMGRG